MTSSVPNLHNTKILIGTLSNQSFVDESCHSLARYEYLQGGQQQFFIVVFFGIRYQTLISDIDTFT